MLDELQLQSIASRTNLADAEAEATTRASAARAADDALSGLHVELDVATKKHQTLSAQRSRRVTEAKKSKQELVAKYFVGGKASTDDGVNIYMRASAEDDFFSDVLALSQQAIDAARAAVTAGELAVDKAALAAGEASVVVLAVRHLAAAAILQATDPGITVEFGPAIVAELDRLSETAVTISKKERGIV